MRPAYNKKNMYCLAKIQIELDNLWFYWLNLVTLMRSKACFLLEMSMCMHFAVGAVSFNLLGDILNFVHEIWELSRNALRGC